MNIETIDGNIRGEHVVFGSVRSGMRVCRGMKIGIPPFENTSHSILNSYDSEIRAFLDVIKPGSELQIRFSKESDPTLLNRYYEDTEKLGSSEFAKQQRHANYVNMVEAMQEGFVAQSAVQIYLTSDVAFTDNEIAQDEAVAAVSKSLRSQLEIIRQSFERCGGFAEMLDEKDLQQAFAKYYSPTPSNDQNKIKDLTYDTEKSILQNCLNSDLVGLECSDCHLHYNNCVHSFIGLKSLPQTTHIGLIDALTSLPIQDYSICAKVEPLDATGIIDKLEAEIAKLRRANRSSNKNSVANTIQVLEERVSRLMVGDRAPYNVQLYVHTWSRNEDMLNAKTGHILAAMNKMNGAKGYIASLPTAARDIYFDCSPGAPNSMNKGFKHYIENVNLSHLLPVSTERGIHQNGCEALYHGNRGSLHGIDTFINEWPAHVAFFGKTGGGKSVGVGDLLVQTDPYYDKTVILDVGESHSKLVEKLSGKASRFIIEPRGKEKLNYLSTCGEALTNIHIAKAAKIVELLSGDFSKGSQYHKALIFRYVRRFYLDWGERFIKELDTQEGITKRGAYALMSEIQQPIHSDFHDWLGAQLKVVDECHAELHKLSTILERWRSDIGQFSLFDGHGTVDLTADVVHIELSKISETETELKAVASFVITEIIRTHIMSLPREQRKRVVFEELGAFLNIEGGDVIVKDFFQRMRKYRCLCISVTQQLEELENNKVAFSIIGNSTQALMFKTEAKDARALQKAFSLPESAVQSLLSFKPPSKETGAAFLHWLSNGNNNQVTTAYNVATPEMLDAAKGGDIERKPEASSGCDDVEESVLIETSQ